MDGGKLVRQNLDLQFPAPAGVIKYIVPPRIQPTRLKLVREAFDEADFIFELKPDGFRGVVYVEDRQCRLVSRNQRGVKFAFLKAVLAKLQWQSSRGDCRQSFEGRNRILSRTCGMTRASLGFS